MKWTHEKPTVPGWYWMKLNKQRLASVVAVEHDAATPDAGMRVWAVNDLDDQWVDDFVGAKWAGPIPEP